MCRFIRMYNSRRNDYWRMVMNIHSIDFAELKRSVSIASVAQYLKLELRQEKHQLRGKCPLCASDNPRSFVITPDKGLFFCHSCATGGDCIKLMALVTNTDARSAAIEIQQKLGSPTAPDTAPSSKPERRASGFDAEAYARKLDPAHANLEPLGISRETLEAWKAGYAASGILRGRLALPLRRDGAVIGYFGLAIDGQQPRLLFPNGVKPEEHLFNAHHITGELGELCLLRDPLAVLKAFELNIGACCFLTDSVSTAQFLMLCAFMELVKCETVEIA